MSAAGLLESYSATAGEFPGGAGACPPCLLIQRPACTLDHWLSNARAEATTPAFSDKATPSYSLRPLYHSLSLYIGCSRLYTGFSNQNSTPKEIKPAAGFGCRASIGLLLISLVHLLFLLALATIACPQKRTLLSMCSMWPSESTMLPSPNFVAEACNLSLSLLPSVSDSNTRRFS